MESVAFDDFDCDDTYLTSLECVLDPDALNFVIEFGREKAHIKFGISDNGFKWLLSQDAAARSSRPVRWINLWSPYRKPETIRVLSEYYKFSARLTAIMATPPPPPKRVPSQESDSEAQLSPHDIEKANVKALGELDTSADRPDENHYTIASHLPNYHSVDVGEKFLCVGANWMHHISKGVERRLWSWLVMCDDGTVISIHEGHGLEHPDQEIMEGIRRHTRRILEQLSIKADIQNTRSVGLISVRQNLPSEGIETPVIIGNEGASNLFYYLFDDWQTSYWLITTVQERLERISKGIFDAPDTRQGRGAGANIIKHLYVIGRELRIKKAVHESYANLIKRILEYGQKPTLGPGPASDGLLLQRSLSFSATLSNKRLVLALTASDRFERLGDRIRLLILSALTEAIAEKDALIDTYFNITAQRDSEATARLSKNGAILSKLGVLFLPVSLMTGYFSVQIEDLNGVYSSKTYWVCFAVLIILSILSLFFFQFWLVRCMELTEQAMKNAPRSLKKVLGRAGKGKEE